MHKFITYYLKFTILEQSKKLTNGNIGNGSLNKTTLKELLIPSISLQHQQEIVDFLDKIYETYKIEDTVKYFKDKNIFNLLIEHKYDEFKNIIWYQEQIPRLICSLEQIPRLKSDYIRGLFNSVKYKEYKFTKLYYNIS